MASSREDRGATRKKNLPYHQSVEHDEYEEYGEEYQYQNENSDRTYNRNALYHSEYTEDEGEYEEREYREGNYEESEYAEYIDPDSPTSPSNGHPLPSPPPSPPTDDGYDDEDNDSNIPPPPPTRSKKLPSIPQYVPDKSQPSRIDDNSQSRMAFRPSAPTPTHQKRKINYFTIGKTLTSRLKFKKSHAKEEEIQNIQNIGPPLPEPPQRIQITLPSLAPSSPISHQLPAEYLEFEEETDNHSEVHTTPELTMDDLYHLVLNMQKGFQLQVDEMNTQIKELKREIKKLKGEEEESEEEEDNNNNNDLEDFRSPSRTATSVRSVTKEMERYGGEGRWFHNEYS